MLPRLFGLGDPAAYAAMSKGASPYGDGHAAGRIVATLADVAGERLVSAA